MAHLVLYYPSMNERDGQDGAVEVVTKVMHATIDDMFEAKTRRDTVRSAILSELRKVYASLPPTIQALITADDMETKALITVLGQ